MAATAAVGYLAGPGIASAAEATAGHVPMERIPLAQIFTLLFLMLGPFKIIGPFARITKGAGAAFTRRIALRATVFAGLALLVASFLGERVLSSYGIPLPVLALSGGMILFLVALQNTLNEFAPHDEGATGPASTPTTSTPPDAMPASSRCSGVRAATCTLRMPGFWASSVLAAVERLAPDAGCEVALFLDGIPPGELRMVAGAAS